MNAPMDVAGVLRRNRLLEELDSGQMAELLGLGHIARFDADQTIFDKGDPGDCLFAVLKGQIAIRTSSADGKTMLLNILETGDVLGEIGLIDGRERTAAAIALRPTHLYRIDRADFIPFLERHPKLCTRMMVVLCERLRWVSENIEDAVFHDVPRRLARRLLLLSDSYGQATPAGLRLTLPLSQEALANMLGVTREMVNKCLGALRKTGAVTYAKGFIVITDLALLKDMAGDPERGP
ncbi:Crp/Fnr family transcriptional regulator [Azospirillum sp. TSO35-2]|uniref:Crp/Fnr family transcriptional regulator n=1 Tax=Azospirillum sp. TSO35-2 TaxID=716796 RepID=UPI000D613434|nr:Crp/Fnr family transcriptional regulator [Azospirillum sp. TSO35-2]PWC37508.1 Crp/Fnr family transcriptional regulator [Azospirillum sp. TSO35-2]